MRRVFIASGISEAQLVRQMLETAGVFVQVLNEHASGGLGELPATEAWPEIWVEREHQLAHARSLIRDYESASDQTVDCGTCSEPNPATFEICWHCRELLPQPG